MTPSEHHPASLVADWEIYQALLRKWQKTINLVAPSTLADAWSRHFLDSVQLLTHIEAGQRSIVDLGSGAGFPGMILALALKDDSHARVHLVESDQRKASFLRTVSRETGASLVRIHTTRIADAFDRIGPVHIVTARALAPLPDLLDMAEPWLTGGAVGLFLKGQDVDAELTGIANPSRFQIDKFPSQTDRRGCVVRIRLLETP